MHGMCMVSSVRMHARTRRERGSAVGVDIGGFISNA